MGKPNVKQVSLAGVHFVLAELHRRGAYGEAAFDLPSTNLSATNFEDTRTVAIRVKSMAGGTWHTSTMDGRPRKKPAEDEARYWILVDLRTPPASPEFYVVPAWWIENDIYETHQAYLKRHDGERPKTRESKHHAIRPPRLVQWRERWDILGIFAED